MLRSLQPYPPVPACSEPDLEGLREFADRTDRQEPPVFVGRQALLDGIGTDLQRRFDQWLAGTSDAWESGTWLVQGAPGAGKTALLRHLRQTLPVRLTVSLEADADPEPCRVCTLHVSDLRDRAECRRRLAEALLPEGGATLSASVSRTRATGGGLGTPGVAQVYQQKTTSTTAPSAEFLQWLHEATDGLPILPVYGGLAWSESRLRQLGLSRLADERVHTLPALTSAECREAVLGFLDKYRVRGEAGERGDWVRNVSNSCQGWPQHLHVGLRALARGLIADEVDGELGSVDQGQVLQEAGRAREDYYQRRLQNSRLEDTPMLAAVAVGALAHSAQAHSVPRLGQAVQRVASRQAHNQDPDYALPDGVSGKQYVQRLIETGVLHKESDGTLYVPIPSFVTYLQETYKEAFALGIPALE